METQGTAPATWSPKGACPVRPPLASGIRPPPTGSLMLASVWELPSLLHRPESHGTCLLSLLLSGRLRGPPGLSAQGQALGAGSRGELQPGLC